MVLGSLVSSGINAISSAASAAANYAYSKKLMKYQQKLQIQNNRRAYGDTRYSLESAGYNPLLAVGSGTGSQTAGMSSGVGADYGSPGSDYANIKLANAQKETQETQSRVNEATALGQEIDNQLKPDIAKSQIDMTNAQTALYKQQEIRSIIENEVLPKSLKAELERTLNESLKIQAETELSRAQTDNVRETTKYIGYNAQTGRMQAINGAVANNVAQYNATTGRLQYENSSTPNALDRWWIEKHPKQARAVYGIGKYIGAFGNIFAGSGSSGSGTGSQSNGKGKGKGKGKK